MPQPGKSTKIAFIGCQGRKPASKYITAYQCSALKKYTQTSKKQKDSWKSEEYTDGTGKQNTQTR